MNIHTAAEQRNRQGAHRQPRASTAATLALPRHVSELIGLQQTLGNQAVAAMQAARVQRQDDFKLIMPSLGDSARPRQRYSLLSPNKKLRLGTNLLAMRGVISLGPAQPQSPPLFASAPKSAAGPAPDKPPGKFWSLDFEPEVEEDSALGRALQTEKLVRTVLSAGEEAEETPLGLKIFNGVTNALLSYPEGQQLLKRWKLDQVTVTLDPTSQTYGVGVRIAF